MLKSMDFITVITAKAQDFIFCLAVSGCGSRLAALHQSGSLSVWRLPGLTLDSRTALQEQPLHDELSPALLQAPERRRAKAEFLASPLRFHPVSVAWWDADSVVLLRNSGAVTVLSLASLTPLLGDSPEFLEGVPRISQCFQKGFFGLECEVVVRGRRPSSREESSGEDPEEEVEAESEDEEPGWLTLGKRSAAAFAFYMTDSERFAPPRKRARVVRRTFRLLALVSTSPEELFSRKIQLEEYGEALLLAQHYNLDTDRVYSRQWRSSNKSSAAIQDYLGKLRGRAEVLAECLNTVPDCLDAAGELLEYGLRATDLEAVQALGQDPTSSQLVLADRERVVVDSTPELERRETARLAARVRWESLNPAQLELVRTRATLLYYRDCLHTQEEILGGGARAAERFRPAEYRALRSRSPLQNLLAAARRGDVESLACLLGGRHTAATAPHWLPALAAFPETEPPELYQQLLPVVTEAGAEPPVWAEPRPADWCEAGAVALHCGTGPQWDPVPLYTDYPEMVEYGVARPGPELVSAWYAARARQMVTRTGLPDRGLALLGLGLERGADFPWRLLHTLRTLDCLVYEVQNGLELETLEQLTDIQQAELLVARQSSVHGVRKFLQPFLQRLEDQQAGSGSRLVAELCVARATSDLTFPLVVLEHSGPDKTGPVLYSVADTVRLALDCCYAAGGSQMDLAQQCFSTVLPYFRAAPSGRQLQYNVAGLQAEVEELQRHLELATLLGKNGVVVGLGQVRDSISDPDAMFALVVAVTERAESARPPLEAAGWRGVLRDLQLLQTLAPGLPHQQVLRGFTASLLASGRPSNIELAGTVLEGVVDAEHTVELLENAWRHYYSQAGGWEDPVLGLARQCLQLGPGDSRQLAVCRDLTAALASLQEFGLGGVLPVEVLHCKDRMELVRRALAARPSAYRNTQRLLKLASLLRLSGPVEAVQGEVWAAIAARALEVGDYSSAQTACNNFIVAGHTRGWDICYALAASPAFPSPESCTELLAFAASHCDREHLGAVLQTILSVEQRGLSGKIANSVEIDMEPGEEGDEFIDAIEDTDDVELGGQIGSSLSAALHIPELAGSFLSRQEGSFTVLQRTRGWLAALAVAEPDAKGDEELPMDDQGGLRVPAFYSSLAPPDSLLSNLYCTYTQYGLPRALASCQIFRLDRLARTLAVLAESPTCTTPAPPSALLSQLAPLLAGQDALLCLALLAAAPECDWIDVLAALPRTLPGLCLALTHLATCLLLPSHQGTVLSCPPRLLVRAALAAPDRSPQLQLYATLASDCLQGEQLSGLAGEVDVARFTADPQYKEDTILGLAMFPEQDKWELCVGLARRYGVEEWLVAATQLTTLLTSGLSPARASQLLTSRHLLATLSSHPDRLHAWCTEKVLPLLDGLDNKMLLLYYKCLSEAGAADVGKQVTALNLMNEEDILVNFKFLEDGDPELLDQLSDENIEFVARLLDILGNSKLTSSKVYENWSFRVFLRHGENKDNWIEAFSNCQHFFEKLQPEDFQACVKRCILSKKTIKMVPRPARGRIFKKAVKFAEVQIAGRTKGDWDTVQDWLMKVKNHSDTLKKPLSVKLISKLDEDEEVIDDFEMTGGDDLEIIKLVSRLISCEHQEEVILTVVQVWKQALESATAGLMEVLQANVDQISGDGPVVCKDPFSLIKNLCENFKVGAEEVSAAVSPLCTNEAVSVQDRLDLVRLLKTLEVAVVTESELDSSMLASLYETQHQLLTILPDFTVEKEDLQSFHTKYSLFQRAVAACSSGQQLVAVYRLVTAWDGFCEEAADEAEQNCLLHTAMRLLELQQQDEKGGELMTLLRDSHQQPALPPTAARELLAECRQRNLGSGTVLKLVLTLAIAEEYEPALRVTLAPVILIN